MRHLLWYELYEEFILGFAKGLPTPDPHYYSDTEVCSRIAVKGDLRLLHLAHENGCRWGPDTPADAAQHGHVACLTYAVEHGCRWGPDTPAAAARHGQAACLAYAVEHGCRVDNTALEGALREGHIACVQYLIHHGAWNNAKPLCVPKYRVPGQAACVEYALDHGVVLHRTSLVVAASFGDLDVVRLLYARGFPLWTQSELSSPLDVCPPTEDDERWGEFGAFMVEDYRNHLRSGVFYFPWWPEGEEACWPTLRFCSILGAVIPRGVLDEMTRRRQTVLQCFHAACRLSRGKGAGLRARLWAAMAAVPQDI
jgi:hypothetical protein